MSQDLHLLTLSLPPKAFFLVSMTPTFLACLLLCLLLLSLLCKTFFLYPTSHCLPGPGLQLSSPPSTHSPKGALVIPQLYYSQALNAWNCLSGLSRTFVLSLASTDAHLQSPFGCLTSIFNLIYPKWTCDSSRFLAFLVSKGPTIYPMAWTRNLEVILDSLSPFLTSLSSRPMATPKYIPHPSSSPHRHYHHPNPSHHHLFSRLLQWLFISNTPEASLNTHHFLPWNPSVASD